MRIPKVVQFMRAYFPEVKGDLELPYLYASNIAEWYADHCMDLTVVNRMKNFFTMMSGYPPGKSADDDLATIVQVGLIERLWHVDNAAKCLSTLFRVEELTVGSEYYKQWIGSDRYHEIIREMRGLT